MGDEDRRQAGNVPVFRIDDDDLGDLGALLGEAASATRDDGGETVHRIDLEGSDADFAALLAETLGEVGGPPAPSPAGDPGAAGRPTPPPRRGVPGAPPGMLPSEVARRREEEQLRVVEQLRQKVRDMSSETDSFRKRVLAEAEGARMQGRADVLRRLLPIMDTLEMAVSSARIHHDAGKLLHGLEMVLKQLVAELGGLGLKPIEAHGQAFDPAHHEAFQKMRTGQVAPGQVCRVIRRGYLFEDRLFRAAQVVVEAEE